MALTIQENHNILLSLAEGKPRALQAARQLSSEEIERAVDQLLEVFQEVEEKEKANAEHDAERFAKANQIAMAIEKAGLSLEEIEGLISAPITKGKVEAKYCIEVNGKSFKWTGRGRIPKAFAQYMDEHNLDKHELPQVSN